MVSESAKADYPIGPQTSNACVKRIVSDDETSAKSKHSRL